MEGGLRPDIILINGKRRNLLRSFGWMHMHTSSQRQGLCGEKMIHDELSQYVKLLLQKELTV